MVYCFAGPRDGLLAEVRPESSPRAVSDALLKLRVGCSTVLYSLKTRDSLVVPGAQSCSERRRKRLLPTAAGTADSRCAASGRYGSVHHAA